MPRITSFSLENFRVFEQKTTFEFAPITILTGANNSGKSSVFKALNLLSKNAKEKNYDFFSQLDFSLGNHHLRDFENVINKKARKNEKKEINFEFGISTQWIRHMIRNEKNEHKEILEFRFLNLKDDIQRDEIKLNYIDNLIKNYKIHYSFLEGKLVSIKVKDDKNETLLYCYAEYENKKGGIASFMFHFFLQKIIFESDIIHSKEVLNTKKLDKIIGENPKKDEFYEILREKIKYLIKHNNFDGRPLPKDVINKDLLEHHFIEKFLIFNEQNILSRFEPLYLYETEKEFKDRLQMEWEDFHEIIEDKLNGYDPKKYLFEGDYSEFKPIIKICGKLKFHEIINQDFAEECKIFSDFFIKMVNFFDLPYTQKGLQFIEGIRANTQRIYTYQSQGTSFNEFLVDISLGKKTINTEFVNIWLKEFGIADRFEINSIKGVANEIFLISGNEKIDLVDMGYGITQILPLILKIAALPRISYFDFGNMDNFYETKYDTKTKKRVFVNDDGIDVNDNGNVPISGGNRCTICIEEPETNLHPKLQSKLADMLIDACKVFNVQFVIETHSEYFIRKLQYWVAKKEIQSEDVNIYYLYNPEEIPKGRKQVERIRIDEDGSLDNDFGTGFFDEADNISIDIFNLQHHKN